jgi:hypothetical protein
MKFEIEVAAICKRRVTTPQNQTRFMNLSDLVESTATFKTTPHLSSSPPPELTLLEYHV